MSSDSVPPIGSVFENLNAWRREQRYCDVQFEVEGETFAAHRLLLAASSPVFKAMLYDCGLKESTDALFGIKVDDVKAADFGLLLHCIYDTTTISPTTFLDADSAPARQRLTQHLIRVWHVADRYDVSNVRVACESMLELGISWSHIDTILQFSVEQQLAQLNEKCVDYLVQQQPGNRITKSTLIQLDADDMMTVCKAWQCLWQCGDPAVRPEELKITTTFGRSPWILNPSL